MTDGFPFDAWQVLAVGSVLFLVALLAVSRARRRFEARQAGALPSARHAAAGRADRPDPALRDDLSDLLLRLEETSRRIGGQIDTRFQMLNRLLAEADLKIKQLKDLVERPAPQGGSLAASLSADPQVAEIYRHADNGMAPLEIARKVNRQRGEVEVILALRRLTR